MQRGRSSGSGHTSRLGSKRMWRTRSKSQSRASAGTTSVWSPMGKSKWMSVTGRIVTLESSLLMHLTEMERITLQGISLSKLHNLSLGCQIKIPKEFNESLIKKKRPYLLKRKGYTSASRKEEVKGSPSAWVFGLPLSKCIENDKQKMVTERESICLGSHIVNSIDDEDYLSRKSSQVGSHASFASLLDGTKQSNTGSLENLSFDRKRPSLGSTDILLTGNPYSSPELLSTENQSQVPRIVSSCCKHIESYGLHTLGIFRVSPSKKRVKQLRDEFDGGREVLLTEEYCPHEVASLLKEFFRDLPDPLLTRELYEPFLNTQKIRNRRQQIEALQFLIQLLPLPNRDTLYVLLNFLTTIAENAADSTDKSGENIQGNKMDSTNIATIFAPNILHQAKAGSEQLTTTEMRTNAMERGDIINVVRSMIDHNKELFEVTSELLNETYQHIMETCPEALNSLLRRRFAGPDDSLDYEVESSSSVFDGSEVSSSVPLSPNEHHEFERLQSTTFGDELEGKQKRLQEVTSTKSYQDKMNRRAKRSPDRVANQGLNESKTKIMAEEKPQSNDKILRRGSKGSGVHQAASGTKILSKAENKENRRGKLNLEELYDGYSGIQVHMSEESTRTTSGSTVRRLSSPELESCNIITASLKIPMPIQQVTSLALSPESDIPYIEDSTTCSRQRTGSNDSFLGQPITGTMSFQPLAQKGADRNSRESMISCSSMGFYTMSPSERDTPNSENPFLSGNSTPRSGITSPPLNWLSPDSGTPGLSPPNTPPPPERKSKKRESLPMQPHSYSMAHSATVKPIPPQRSRSRGVIQKISPLSKSRTSDAVRDISLMQYKEHQSKGTAGRRKMEDSLKCNPKLADSDASKKGAKKRYGADRQQTGQLGDHQLSRDGSQHVWKRWEIIASDPTEPETYV